MVRFGLFVVVLILVFAPLVWLQAEGEAPIMALISGDPGLLVAGGASDGPFTVTRVFRSPDSLPGKLYLERRLEAPPSRGALRRTKTCRAQASPGMPAPGTAAPETAAPGTAAPGTRDLCDVGYEISRMSPCTSAEDCPAYELWSSELGAPGVQPAQPDRLRRIFRPSRLGVAPPASPGDDR